MKKIPLIIVLIFILNLLFRGLLINYVPNSVSFQEIDILRLVNFYPVAGNFSFRIVNIFIAILINIGLFYLIYKKTKNVYLSLSVSLVLSFSPWFFVLSGYLNYYLIPILLTIVILSLIPDKKISTILAVVFLTIFRFTIISHDIASIRLSQFIPDLIRLFDLCILFFSGDLSSPMLRIPLTGFFYYFDLFAFFSGLYYLFSINKNQSLKNFLNQTLLLGLLYFLILPAEIITTERGELVFLWMTIIIGFGYYNFFRLLRGKSILLVSLLMLTILINISFTTELFINHFDRMNSDDWTYAEQTAVQFLLGEKNHPIYLTNQSDKLYRYWQFFKLKDMKVSEIDINLMKKLCQNPQSICIANEAELPSFNINKDEVKIMFGNDNGLPIYFVLPNKIK